MREEGIKRIISLQEETIPRIGITGVVPKEDIRTREEVLLGTEMATIGGTTAKVVRRLVLVWFHPALDKGVYIGILSNKVPS